LPPEDPTRQAWDEHELERRLLVATGSFLASLVGSVSRLVTSGESGSYFMLTGLAFMQLPLLAAVTGFVTFAALRPVKSWWATAAVFLIATAISLVVSRQLIG
jgi:hypothetical protein